MVNAWFWSCQQVADSIHALHSLWCWPVHTPSNYLVPPSRREGMALWQLLQLTAKEETRFRVNVSLHAAPPGVLSLHGSETSGLGLEAGGPTSSLTLEMRSWCGANLQSST